MKARLLTIACISMVCVLLHPVLANAALLSDVTYSLSDIDSDSSWDKVGTGAIVPSQNRITGVLEVSRTFSDAQNNNFLIESNISSDMPSAGPAEAGARLFARIHTDELANPLAYRELQVRFQREASDADNFVGLYNHTGTLLTDVNNNVARILVNWNETNPPFRFRLRRVSDQVSLDLMSSLDRALIQSVTVDLNDTNFPALTGIPDASLIGFGNLLVTGSTDSYWEDLRVATWEPGDSFPPAPVPLPGAVWLFGSGLVGLIGFAGSRKRFNP